MSGAAPTKSENTPSRPDFGQAEAWIFDLDHTLYTTNAAEQAEMEERICRYVQHHFGLPRDQAWEIQKSYLRDYGSTLAGMISNHHLDPDAYHDEVNDLEALALSPDAALRAGLERLPGRRFVFTNNCGRFARNVLTQLGIEDLFAGIVDVKAMDFILKPSPKAFETLIALSGLVPERAALFDDSPRNLIPARVLGMRTVWLNNGLGLSHWKIERPELHIDYETDNLATFLHTIRI
ncbi:MAG TPA: pyrimidine 5'-nucleotidase [Rhizomicrobium sp.]